MESKGDNRSLVVRADDTERDHLDWKSSGSPGWLMKDERQRPPWSSTPPAAQAHTQASL